LSITYEDKLAEIFKGFPLRHIHADYGQPIIFVCGGNTPLSVRHKFIQYCTARDAELEKCFIRAEVFKDYLAKSIYPDLLTFEDDIANVSSRVIIFLESPGAIAELGLFCARDQFKEKLIVFAQTNKVDGMDSFIYLGPITYLKRLNESAVNVYPWTDDGEIDNAHLSLILADVKESLNKAHREEKFNIKNTGHVAFLIHDIISVAQPVRLVEIQTAVSATGIDIIKPELERLLYLLKCVNLISSQQYSSSEYFYTATAVHKLSISNTHFDRTESKIALSSFTLETNVSAERKRRNVSEALRGGAR